MKPTDPAAPRHVPYLDGWRGLAVAMVLLAHLASPILIFAPVALDAGRMGLDLFFVLSGRLMAEILFVRATPLRPFYKRRFSRVWPALFVFVVLVYAADVLFLHETDSSPWPYLSALTFTLNYYNIYSHSVPMLEHVWSLCVEEHAYALLGLMAWLHRRHRWPVVPMLLAILVACDLNHLARTLWVRDDVYPQWRTDIRLPCILSGSLAYVLARGPSGEAKDLSARGPFFQPLVVALLGFLGLASLFASVSPLITCTVGVAALALFLAVLSEVLRRVQRALSIKVATYAGLISYSLYLWQQPFFKLDAAHRPLLLLGLAVAALASYYLVERPVREGLNRWFNRGRLAGGSSPVASGLIDGES